MSVLGAWALNGAPAVRSIDSTAESAEIAEMSRTREARYLPNDAFVRFAHEPTSLRSPRSLRFNPQRLNAREVAG